MVGQVAVCSHGMGAESVDAMIEGLFPILKKSGAKPVVFRIGSSGGIGDITPHGEINCNLYFVFLRCRRGYTSRS